MNFRVNRFLFALWLTLSLGTPFGVQAQEAPPAPVPAPAPAAPEVKPAEAPAEDESTPPAVEPEEDAEKVAAEAPLRELGSAPAKTEVKMSEPIQLSTKKRVRVRHQDGPPLGSHRVPAGVKQSEVVSLAGDSVVDGEVSSGAVSIFGSTTVNGTTGGEAVSILGSTTVNGKVGDGAISILGTTTVNGHVSDNAVAILGDVVLGPDAVVEGDIVTILGKVVRADTAQAKGSVQQIGGFGPFSGVDWLHAYLEKCVYWGRPLWFGEHLGWAWVVAGCFLLFYMLLALLFPRGIERSAEVLEQRPGGTLIASLLTVLLSPILIILLVFTGIGIAFIPFLAVAFLIISLFGKAALLAWLGRRLWRNGSMPLCVLLGGLIVTALYLIPVLGYLLYKLFGVLGTGMVVYRIVLATKREKAPLPAGAPAFAAAAVPPVASQAQAASFAGEASYATSSGFAAEPAAGAVPPPVAALTPLSAATLPRAGFWIRLAAAVLDAILVAIAIAFLDHLPLIGWIVGGYFPLWYAVYCVSMWKWKGTTIGGIVCGLKVVRLDDRPIDWGVAVVRALGGFLSLAVAGLGFIWVAFDDEKQSWHDKIAGTTLVKVPRGTPLV